MNRLTKQTLPDPDGGSRLARPVTSFTYDVVGNLDTVTEVTNRGIVTKLMQRAFDELSTHRRHPVERVLSSEENGYWKCC